MKYSLTDLRPEFEKVKTAWDILANLRVTTEIMGIGLDGKTTRVLTTKQTQEDKPEKITEDIIKPWVEIKLGSVNTFNEDFEKFHNQLVGDLKNTFDNRPKPVLYSNSKRKVPWSVCAKILDLILLYGINNNAKARTYFHKKGNLALDSYTLKAIKRVCSDVGFTFSKNVDDFFKQNRDLRMGSIASYCNYDSKKERKIYRQLQMDIMRFIKDEIQIPEFYPFHFDKWAWQNELLMHNLEN